jgi:hypothetical protein
MEPCSYEPVMFFQAKVGHNVLFVKSVKVKRKEVKVEEYIIDNT